MLNQSRGKAQQTLVLQVPQEKLNLGRGCVCMLSHFSHVRLFAILWTVARQAPLSMGFSREEYWSGLPFLSPGALPDLGIELRFPTLQADSLPSAMVKNTLANAGDVRD